MCCGLWGVGALVVGLEVALMLYGEPGGCSARFGGGVVCGGLCWDGRGGAGHNLRVNNSTAVQPGWAVGIGDRKR